MPNVTSTIASRPQGEELPFWDANPCGGTWGKYADFLAWMMRTEPYAFEILNRYEWTGKQVLDVGCGQGALLNYLPSLGAQVFGVDMSSASLGRASSGAVQLGHADRVHLSRTDALSLPFADNRFDVVISFGVLHRTQDTWQGVREVWRVLKPGGLALVMLYRTGNPKWWMVQLSRSLSRGVDTLTGKSETITNWLRPRHESDDLRGTALLELFGCPILQAFSRQQIVKMFSLFSHIEVSHHQPGFRRLADILPVLRPLTSALGKLDQRVTHAWGFYQVIEAYK
jgi:SAM-dependent methyltransferase